MTIKTLTQSVKSPWLLVPFFLLLVSCLSALWFFHNFEKKEYTITTGSSPQARNNPLLAAQEYLQLSGYRSESVKGLDLLTELPPVSDAIFIRHLPAGLSNSITKDLLFWVEQGGHLLVMPNLNALASTHPGRTTLFEQLGVDLVEREETDCGCPNDDEEDAAASTETDTVTEGTTGEQQENKTDQPEPTIEPGPYHLLIYADLDEQTIQLETLTPQLLRDKSNSAVFSIDGSYFIDYEEEEDKQRGDQNDYIERDGAWLLQYRIGAGKVTVLSEMYLFNNSRVGDYDHAFFLSWLTRDDSTVWMLYSTVTDSFLKILWEKAPLFWLTLAVLLVLIIWRLQMQSGSQLRPALDERHNIMQHIDATAQYYWRTSNLKAMVNYNRKVVWNRLIGRKMGVQADRQNMDIDISRLAQKTGMTKKQLYAAFQQSIETEPDLIQTSNFMQHLNVHISGGDKKKNDK
jgi:DNA-binding phage protein